MRVLISVMNYKVGEIWKLHSLHSEPLFLTRHALASQCHNITHKQRVDDCSHVSIIFTPHQTMGNRTFISEERRLNSWKWLNLYINKDTFFQEKNLPLKIFITVASEKLSQYETRVNYSSWTKSLSRNWPVMLHWKYIFYFISTLASRKLLSRWMDVKIVCFPEKSKLIYQPK